MCISAFLQRRVAADVWNDANKYGPCFELFFFLMRRELGGKLGGAVLARSTQTESIPQSGIGSLCFLEEALRWRVHKGCGLPLASVVVSLVEVFHQLLSVHFLKVCLFYVFFA